MNYNNNTLTIFKMKGCKACTIFTIKTYGKLKKILFNDSQVDQIENIMMTHSKLKYYKDLYNLDSKTGVPLLIIEKHTRGNMKYAKYKGKNSEISEILKWINDFLD